MPLPLPSGHTGLDPWRCFPIVVLLAQLYHELVNTPKERLGSEKTRNSKIVMCFMVFNLKKIGGEGKDYGIYV